MGCTNLADDGETCLDASLHKKCTNLADDGETCLDHSFAQKKKCQDYDAENDVCNDAPLHKKKTVCSDWDEENQTCNDAGMYKKCVTTTQKMTSATTTPSPRRRSAPTSLMTARPALTLASTRSAPTGMRRTRSAMMPLSTRRSAPTSLMTARPASMHPLLRDSEILPSE